MCYKTGGCTPSLRHCPSLQQLACTALYTTVHYCTLSPIITLPSVNIYLIMHSNYLPLDMSRIPKSMSAIVLFSYALLGRLRPVNNMNIRIIIFSFHSLHVTRISIFIVRSAVIFVLQAARQIGDKINKRPGHN